MIDFQAVIDAYGSWSPEDQYICRAALQEINGGEPLPVTEAQRERLDRFRATAAARGTPWPARRQLKPER